MRRTPPLLAAVTALALLSAACGTGGDPAAASPDGGDAADRVAAADSGQESSDDEMSDDEMSDDEMSDDEMSGDEMSDDEMSDDMATTFRVTFTNVSGGFEIAAAGARAVPIGAAEPGPALPGGGYEFDVPRSATRLGFATMFVQSNDWFWSPGPDGLALFEADGSPRIGDVTADVTLWDAGTEVDQTPGAGPDQAPRQSGPNTGAADPDPTVRAVGGYEAADHLHVTLAPNPDGTTTVRIDNTSASAAVPGPIAPVSWAVHPDGTMLFTPGTSAPVGLEALAEDGDPSALTAALSDVAGTVTPFAPVAWVVDDGDALFEVGDAASPGLEKLAEDGDPSGLVAEVTSDGHDNSGAAANPDGGAPGPALPGSSYRFEFTAHEGDELSLASMFVQSNDWFAAVDGLDLFDDGLPVSGDVSAQLRLYDAGTEIDQAPGAGPDQAPRQAGPNTGAADPDPEIRAVDIDLSTYVEMHIEVVG